jgi:hypothetical protein
LEEPPPEDEPQAAIASAAASAAMATQSAWIVFFGLLGALCINTISIFKLINRTIKEYHKPSR